MRRGPGHRGPGPRASTCDLSRSTRAAAVRVILHVALVEVLAIRAQDLHAVQLHIDDVSPLPRLAAIPHAHLDGHAVLGGPSGHARVREAGEWPTRDRTVGVDVRDVIVDAIRHDMELAQNPT